MDYSSAENQITKVELQAQTLFQSMQGLAQKLRTGSPDEATGREWAMDLREIALTMQTQNQTVVTLINQMAEYIHSLEGQLATHPNPTVPPRGWSSQPSFGTGGGFWNTVTSGLGMGAGFAVASDVVGSLFNML
ncbi:MAG: hypothetical protein ACYC9J_12930 [Sulfuricaulis sp.]